MKNKGVDIDVSSENRLMNSAHQLASARLKLEGHSNPKEYFNYEAYLNYEIEMLNKLKLKLKK